MPLEDVWNDLQDDNQQALMDSVVSAIRAFQMLPMQNDKVLQDVNMDGETRQSLLHPEAKDLSNCQITEDSDGLAITTTDNNIGDVELSPADPNELNDNIVLCHYDLEPRNILVTSNGLNGSGSPWYEIVAIIDWEDG
ncbi:hypothetical protein LY78DRAFT_676876 [Colletotrichum sublineola]|nr:hypothetical protein LY78DRAFT_676876 [Colletotrichum sublineola]